MTERLETATASHHPRTSQVLRKAQVASLLGVSNATLDRIRLAGKGFPAPLYLSVQAVGWPLADIENWLSTLPRATH